MLALLKPFWLSILKYASIAGAVLLVVFKIRQSGRDAERVENMERDLEYAKDVIRQDNIVRSGDASRMRTKLSEAMRRKRDS